MGALKQENTRFDLHSKKTCLAEQKMDWGRRGQERKQPPSRRKMYKRIQARDHGGLGCRSGFLHLGTNDIRDQMVPCCEDCPGHGMTSAASLALTHQIPVAYCQMCPGAESALERTAGLGSRVAGRRGGDGAGEAAERTLMCSGGGMAGPAEELWKMKEREESRKICTIT